MFCLLDFHLVWITIFWFISEIKKKKKLPLFYCCTTGMYRSRSGCGQLDVRVTNCTCPDLPLPSTVFCGLESSSFLVVFTSLFILSFSAPDLLFNLGVKIFRYLVSCSFFFSGNIYIFHFKELRYKSFFHSILSILI